jgi:hypothetical protein
MSAGKKVLYLAILVALSIGLSAPWQKIVQPIFFGFLPAPMLYLLLVHFLFMGFLGFLAFGTKLHGRIDDEQAFLAKIQSERRES